MKAGNDKVKAAAANIGKPINGWKVGSAFDRAFYNGNLPPEKGTWDPPAVMQAN